MRGLLTSASEELPNVPLYYNLHTMCKTLHVTPPANNIVRSAIINAGALELRLQGSCEEHVLCCAVPGQRLCIERMAILSL